jgi:hypothetical protein
VVCCQLYNVVGNIEKVSFPIRETVWSNKKFIVPNEERFCGLDLPSVCRLRYECPDFSGWSF